MNATVSGGEWGSGCVFVWAEICEAVIAHHAWEEVAICIQYIPKMRHDGCQQEYNTLGNKETERRYSLKTPEYYVPASV